MLGFSASPTAKKLVRPHRPRGWPRQATAGLFPQERSLPAERRWQCGSCAGRQVRRPNQDRVDLQSAPDWRTTRQAWPAACWLRKAAAPSALAMPLCRLDFMGSMPPYVKKRYVRTTLTYVAELLQIARTLASPDTPRRHRVYRRGACASLFYRGAPEICERVENCPNRAERRCTPEVHGWANLPKPGADKRAAVTIRSRIK